MRGEGCRLHVVRKLDTVRIRSTVTVQHEDDDGGRIMVQGNDGVCVVNSKREWWTGVRGKVRT